MTAIARNQENTTDNINWFTTVNDVLTDMYAVEFRVFNIESGLPGTQIFPSSGWEDVTSAPGNFDTGCYYAYDNTNAEGWTPDVDAELGTHRIYWRWMYTSGSAWQEGAEDFQLVGTGIPPGVTYISLGDVRAEGLTDPPYSDNDINTAIVMWQQALERACRQWFYSRELDLYFDGNNSDMIHFGVPIIDVTSLQINGSTTDLDTTLYKVYNSRTYPDDRRNPRIKLVHSTQLEDIYVAFEPRGELKFRKGYKNQRVQGTFGFTESDGTTPQLISRALLKLVIEKLTRPIYTAPGTAPPTPSSVTVAGVVMEEKTDGHSIKYATGSTANRRVGLSGLTSDPEILDIIRMYRAPIGIATPSHWTY
jgi:hypothetical protein